MQRLLLMIVYLPKPSILESIRSTPVETLKECEYNARRILAIIQAKRIHLRGGRVANSHHPSVLMWEKYPSALEHYHQLACIELLTLGEDYPMPELGSLYTSISKPYWLGYPLLHESHSTFNYDAVIWPSTHHHSIMHWKKFSEEGLTSR